MRFDLNGFWRKLACRSGVSGFASIRINVVNRDVRVGDRRLFQIFVDAASATYIAALELDRHARTTAEAVMMRLLVSGGIVRYPFDAVVRDVFVALFAGGDVFALSLAVDDFRLISPGVDLNFEIVRGFSRRRHGN